MPARLSIFEDVFQEITKCRRCRDEIPEIAQLSEQEFAFHWTPYVRGPLPVKYVFFGWEPAWPLKKDFAEISEKNHLQEGGFNILLRFAIQEFLIGRSANSGFLITNMAQCSMGTGPRCDNTRSRRFELCSSYLIKQLSLCDANACLISIGWEPKRFIERRSDVFESLTGKRSIHRITHYGSRCNVHFKRFAKRQQLQFDSFIAQIRPTYERFCESDEGPRAVSTGGLERLFKWRCEMKEIALA